MARSKLLALFVVLALSFPSMGAWSASARDVYEDVVDPGSVPETPPVPPERGTWGNSVEREPNTAHDRDDRFMWSYPDATSDPAAHVYLDGFLLQEGAGDFATPYSGSYGAKFRAFAFFGAWKDCNEDGYIGDATTGLLVYRSEQPHNDTMCPSHSPWNSGAWVHEFQWITTPAVGATESSGLSDPGARVWADLGGPEENVQSAQDQVYPLPAGSLDDASVLPEWGSSLVGTPVDAPSADDPAGTYADRVWEREQRDSTPSSVGSPVGARCDVLSEPLAPSTRDDPDWTLDPAPPAPYVALLPTLAAWNTSARQCLGADAGTPADDHREPVHLEAPASVGKDHPDFVLRYHAPPASPTPLADSGGIDGSRAPGSATCVAGTCEGWWSDAIFLGTPNVNVGPWGFVDPTATTQTDVRPSAANEFTTTAFVTPGAISRYNLKTPNSAVGSYGAEHCGTHTVGAYNGWDCDATHWRQYGPVAVGYPYDLRDVDPLRGIEVIESPGPRDRDADGDRMGDEWVRSYLSQARDRLNDPDGDCVTNFGEWAWGLYPVSVHPGSRQALVSFDDLDVDGMKDAQEIARWNSKAPDEYAYFVSPVCAARWGEAYSNTGATLPASVPGIAQHDADASLDTDGDGVPNILDPDSDNDGLPDGAEYNTYGSYPEYADSDCALAAVQCPLSKGTAYDATGASTAGTGDGIPDAEEVRYWNALHGEGAWQQDCDGDGIINLLDPDSDNDGILDGDEMTAAQPSDPCGRDADKDGLDDAYEHQLGTDPAWYDSDHDGMPDGWEVNMGLDPLVNDASFDNDGDLMANGDEYHYKCPASWFEPRDGTCTTGTNALAQNSDGDNIWDGIEYATRVLDPTVDDRYVDADHDNLPNALEYAIGTNAGDADTDHDGLRDDVEVAGQAWADLGLGVQVPTGGSSLFLSNASDDDTDQDGLTDGIELSYWQNRSATAVYEDYDHDSGGAVPCNDCPVHLVSNLRDADADGDRLDDGQEVLVYGTDPTLQDTDGDGSPDYNEIFACHTSPTDPADTCAITTDPRLDTDADGIPDVDESWKYCTDPYRADTDGDFLDDKTEIAAWKTGETSTDLYHDYDSDGPYCNGQPTNVLDADSDNDGLVDGVEFGSGGLPRELFYVSSPRIADVDNDHLLDGEESHNDLVGDAIACAAQDPALAKTLADEWNAHIQALLSGPAPTTLPQWIVQNGCASIVGAYGVHLFAARPANPALCVPHGLNRDCTADPTRSAPTDGACSWAGRYGDCAATDPSYSANDETNTDGDGLEYDGDEVHTYHTGPGSADTDADGVNDDVEIQLGGVTDTDGDGYENARDPDADGDTINDGEEHPTDPHAPTYWLDADTDDDGLEDNYEIQTTGTMPNDPDSDADGLPDGLETGLTEPQHPIGVSPWLFTDASHVFGCGAFHRPSFIANQGQTGAARSDPLDGDSDDDGLIDGLEDTNANGIQETSETQFKFRDSDHDHILDGPELAIWGTYTLCQIFPRLSHGSSTEATLKAILENKPRFSSDPLSADSDLDGVPDGIDIDPRGLASIGIDLGTFQMLENVDINGYGIDPMLAIEWSFQGTSAAAVRTPAPLTSDWMVRDPRPFAEIVKKDAFEITNVESFGPKMLLGVSGGLLQIAVPNNVRSYTSGSAKGIPIHITLGIRDADTWTVDPIDINNNIGQTDLSIDALIGASVSGNTRSDDIVGTGQNDGDGWWESDEDGRVVLSIEDLVAQTMLQRAFDGNLGDVPVPSGACFQVGPCAGG